MAKLYRSREFLQDHIRRTLAFYDRNAFDPEGGFFHCLMCDGTVFDRATRTLVASCRVVFNYAMAWRLFGEERHRRFMLHALMNTTVIIPAQTDSSNTAASGAPTINMIIDRMALVAANAMAALSRSLSMAQITADTISPISKISITVRFTGITFQYQSLGSVTAGQGLAGM